MDLDAYLADYRHHPGSVPTPIVVTVGGKRELRSLSSVLYGAPPPESAKSIRSRMAELILKRVSAAGNVTRYDLRDGGFTDEEIDRHYPEALRRSRVTRLGPELT